MKNSPDASSPPDRRRWRHALEYHAARAILFGLSIPPLSVSLWVGRRLGDLLRLVARRHRQRVFDHIEDRLGLTGDEARIFVKKNFQHYGMVVAEVAFLSRIGRKRQDIDNLIDMSGFEPVAEKLLAEGKGVLFITPHFGNWEWCNTIGMRFGCEGGSIARPLDNMRVNEYLRSIRERFGLPIFDKVGAIRKALGVLKRKGAVGVLIDQDAGRQGMMSMFLGKPASTLTVPEEMAIRTGSPMVIAGLRRNLSGKGRHFILEYRAEPYRPTPGADPAEETRRLVDALNEGICEIIMTAPEQWLWVHRRWKNVGKR